MSYLRKISVCLGVAGLTAVLIFSLPYIIYQGPSLPPGIKVKKIVVVKSQKRLFLMDGQQKVKSYPAALGSGQGPKRKHGDGRTPEGIYENCYLMTRTTFYKAIYITYPNAEERRKGYAGGGIEIHGLPPLAYNLERYLGLWIVLWGYTEGCVMVTNQAMDEVVGAVQFPVTVEILP